MKLAPTLIGIVLLLGVGIGANALVAARTRALLDDPAATKSAARPLPVETTRLVPRSTIVVPRTFTGTVEARRHTELAFEGAGRIEQVFVEEGQRVETNDVLAVLDTEQLLAQREEIASRRIRLQAQLDELLAGPRAEVIDAARADIDALNEELELARLQRDRRAQLAERGSISAEQVDTTRAQFRTAQARLKGARARLLELENGSRSETLAAQRGALGEVDTALASIDVQIDRAALRAPFSGTIEARYLDEGAVVSQQMPQPAFALVESGALEARIGVPSELVDEIVSDGSTVALSVRGKSVDAARVRPLPTVDSGTRTVTVVLELTPGSTVDVGVRPGDIISLVLSTERDARGAWIPLAALAESTRGLWSAYAVVPAADDEGAYVTERLELEVLHVEGDRAYVRGTIDGPTLVVVSGAHRLVPGQAVAVRPETAVSAPLKD